MKWVPSVRRTHVTGFGIRSKKSLMWFVRWAVTHWT
jgi:hypothetical protein